MSARLECRTNCANTPSRPALQKQSATCESQACRSGRRPIFAPAIADHARQVSHYPGSRANLPSIPPTIAVISIFRCSDYIQAQLLAGLLREHNIEVFLQGAMLQGALGELPAMGHLSLMVDVADRVAAERIIAAYERGDLELDEEDAE